jgi:5-methylcytosine-specific restriction endonuclease McrA
MKIKNRLPIPEETRQAVLARAEGCCEDCGGVESRLEMHHVRYTKFPDVVHTKHDMFPVSVLGVETPDDLLALCRECHLAKHVDPFTGEFYADPEELADELAYRDHMWR